MEPTTSLGALFLASFLAATLLPGGSEAALFGVLKLHPDQLWPALAVATAGNTLGGLSSYLIGRLIPQQGELRGLTLIRRWGSPVLLLSWVPLIGDALCLAAGWLRLHWPYVAVLLWVGKFIRYGVLLWLLQ